METNQFEDYETWVADILEDGELTAAEREYLSKEFEPTPENIKALGVDAETAKAFFFIMGKLNDHAFITRHLDEGFSKKSWGTDDIKLRAMCLPDFFQALFDVTDGMLTGRLETTLARVQRKLPFFLRQAADPSEFKFRTAINELGNIASGKLTL